MSNFVPADFVPPVLNHSQFKLRKLEVTDAQLDYTAVMSSIDLIRRIRSESWPFTKVFYSNKVIPETI